MKASTKMVTRFNLFLGHVSKGFAAKVHVHIDGDGTIWDASLNLSNVSGNNNKVRRLRNFQAIPLTTNLVLRASSPCR